MAGLEPGSLLPALGIVQGDVIVQIGNTLLASPTKVVEALKGVPSAPRVDVVVERTVGDQRERVTLRYEFQ